MSSSNHISSNFYDKLINVNVSLQDIFTNKITINEVCINCKGTCSIKYKKCIDCQGTKYVLIYNYDLPCIVHPTKVICKGCDGKGYKSFSNEADDKCKSCSYGMKKVKVYFNYDEYVKSGTNFIINDVYYKLHFSNKQYDKLNESEEKDKSSYFVLDKHLYYVKVISLNDILNRKTFVINHLDGTKIIIKNKKIINPNKIYTVYRDENKSLYLGKDRLLLRFKVIYPEQIDEIKLEPFLDTSDEKMMDNEQEEKIVYIEDLDTN